MPNRKPEEPAQICPTCHHGPFTRAGLKNHNCAKRLAHPEHYLPQDSLADALKKPVACLCGWSGTAADVAWEEDGPGDQPLAICPNCESGFTSVPARLFSLSPRQSVVSDTPLETPEQAPVAIGKLSPVTLAVLDVLPPVGALQTTVSERVLTYHNIARSCAAFAVFYGAMAGQELVRAKQKCGNRKFEPWLRENMPWIALSTVHLYIGYAKKFQERLNAIVPTVGTIDLTTLPDPRDYEAAERTELFAKVHEATGAMDVQQMWLALGLMKEPKERGGYRAPKCAWCGGELPPQAEQCPHCHRDTATEPDSAEVEAVNALVPIREALQLKWSKHWAALPKDELLAFDQLVQAMRRDLKGALA